MEPNFIDKFLADNSDLADEYLSHPDKPDVSKLLRAYLISTKGYGNPSHIVHLLRMGLETLRSAKIARKTP